MPEVMPRVTRAQAEAAVERMRNSLCLEIGDQCNCWACMEAVCIYAYLAQRPDEDTVRKGHEFTRQIDEGYVFCKCGHDFDVHHVRACPHGDEPVLPCGVKGCACLDFEASMDAPLAAIRAAMYQPEEEA